MCAGIWESTMFLTTSNLVHYVSDRGFVDVAKVVEGDFIVLEAGRRNRNFKVICGDGGGLFIKQVKVVESRENSTLRREAECYQLAREHNAWATLMPRLICHDTRRQCIVLELIPNSENLTEHFHTQKTLSSQVSELIGHALAQFHHISIQTMSTHEGAISCPRRVPWILFFHRDNNRVSPGVIELGDQIRRSEILSASMDRLCQQWNFDEVIHGDMKWENCVVHPCAEGIFQLKIVDWELLDFGDSAWDLGGVFHSFFLTSLLAAEFYPLDGAEDMVGKLMLNVSSLLPAMRTLWHRYRECRWGDETAQSGFLIRAIEFSSARLLQSAFERLYNATALTMEAKRMLTVSEKIFSNPQWMIDSLGLSRESSQCNKQH